MKAFDFVITGLQSWDIPIGSNAIDIAREISKKHRVLYVNSPLDITTLLSKHKNAEDLYRTEVLKGKVAPLREIGHNLWVLDFTRFVASVNFLPDGFLFDFVNRLNNKIIIGYIKKYIRKLGFSDVIHFVDNDIYRSFYAKELLQPKLSVYYRRDNLHPFPYWKKHIGRLEPLLIKKSDLVICNSPQLAEYALRYNSNSHNIGQGVDLSAYNPDAQFEIPSSFAAIPRPIVGYIGDINSLRLDVNLIYAMALSRPEYSFVFIGKEDQTFKEHALHSLPNVYFLGSIPKSEVPRYMSVLDVCINPQLINEITIGNYPRKVDEYLAMGKPVVATATKTMELFKEHVFLCNTVEDYVQALDKALTKEWQEKAVERIAFARSHTWENNVLAIYKLIEQTLKK